eukprot:TRINITY_DN8756_c0_g1_i6.p1 TRINITY_DN8756_c0_g1~~TRINITY_DN8756_c0_g1_i6.p1  ORF type:complete len:143 (+),score=53.06 TRINITY_DN8756_c0_g1_i6:372-800(+)
MVEYPAASSPANYWRPETDSCKNLDESVSSETERRSVRKENERRKKDERREERKDEERKDEKSRETETSEVKKCLEKIKNYVPKNEAIKSMRKELGPFEFDVTEVPEDLKYVEIEEGAEIFYGFMLPFCIIVEILKQAEENL